jgi:hypothetical protein
MNNQPHDQKKNAQQDAQRKGDAHRVVDDAAGVGTAGSEGGGLDPGEGKDDATGPLQDGEKRGNTTRGDAGGGDHGKSR